MGKGGKEGSGFGSDFGSGWEEGVRPRRELGEEDGRLVAGRLVDLGLGPEGGMADSSELVNLDLHLHRHQVRGLQAQPHWELSRKRKQEPPMAGY